MNCYAMTHIDLNDLHDSAWRRVCSRFTTSDVESMRGDLSYRTLHNKILLLIEEDKEVENIDYEGDHDDEVSR